MNRESFFSIMAPFFVRLATGHISHFLTVIISPTFYDVESKIGQTSVFSASSRLRNVEVVVAAAHTAEALNSAALTAKGERLLFFSAQYIMSRECLLHHIIEQLKDRGCVVGATSGSQLSSLMPLGRTITNGIQYPPLEKPLRFDKALVSLNLLGQFTPYDPGTTAQNDCVKNMSIPKDLFLDIGGFDPNLDHLWGMDFLKKMQRNNVPIRHAGVVCASRQLIPAPNTIPSAKINREMARIICRNSSNDTL